MGSLSENKIWCEKSLHVFSSNSEQNQVTRDKT